MSKKLFIKTFFILTLTLSLLLNGCAKIIDLSGDSDTPEKQEQTEEKQTPEKEQIVITEDEETPGQNIVSQTGLTPATLLQNDYAGACQRIKKIQDSVVENTSVLEAHNAEIINSNPENYWDVEDFFFLDFSPVYEETFLRTWGFNEIDSEDALASYANTIYTGSGYNNVSFYKREHNNYLLRYKGYFVNQSTWKKIDGTCEETCIYDPSKGALQFQSVAYDSSSRLITTKFYEFVPLGADTYIFQDSDERMCVHYYDGQVYAFTYSKLLDGEKYKIKNNNPTKLNEQSVAEYYASKITDPNLQYGQNDNIAADEDYSDSIFENKDRLGDEWVLEKGAFSKTIRYDGTSYDVVVLNEFNNEYDEIIISLQSSEQE